MGRQRLATTLAVAIVASGCTATMVTTTKRDAEGNPYTEQHVEQRFDGQKFGQILLLGVAAGLVGAAASQHGHHHGHYGHYYRPPVIVPVVVPVAAPAQHVVVEHHYEGWAPPAKGTDNTQRSEDDEYNDRIWKEQASFGK